MLGIFSIKVLVKTHWFDLDFIVNKKCYSSCFLIWIKLLKCEMQISTLMSDGGSICGKYGAIALLKIEEKTSLIKTSKIILESCLLLTPQ